MFRQFFESFSGAGPFAIISMLIFIAVFAGIVIWVIRADKSHIRHMENLPLEADHTDLNHGDHNND